MLDPVSNYVANFSDPILTITSGLLVIITTLILWLWFANRKKYHNLKHAIPAHVVKNYLDSIIQNSTALKSSLFRGGGLDLGIPSVMPLQGLGGGEGIALSGAPSTALLEELNQKKALISQLEAQLGSLQNANRDLESKYTASQAALAVAEAKIKELEALLAKLKQGNPGAGDEALKAELRMVTKERDEIRDRLKEFEIISDDLANLKRLQQENEQLKRSLSAQGGSPKFVAPPPVAEPDVMVAPNDVADLLEDIGGKDEVISEDNKALEDFLSEPAAPLTPDETVAAASPDIPLDNDTKPKSDKTPEDLLSEFEKMLG